MGWYRCGGGGIPSSLKTDMNAVYNKKFGTSTTYDPSVWASTANLMGPLPEKTASGSVASITDGADGVPIKNWLVTLPASLDGYLAVNGTQMGVNAWNEEWELGIWNSLGKKSASSNAIRSKDYIPVFPGAEYYIYCDFSVYSSGIIFRLLDENKDFVRTVVINSSSTKKITMDSSVKYIAWCSSTADGITTYSNNVSVNYPSTITSYAPFVQSTTYTASLGHTIYGGSVDVVNGTGTEKYNKITLSSLLTDLNVAQIGTTGVYRIRFSLADAKGAVNSAVFNGLCDYYTPITANQTYNKNEGISINTSGQCYIYDSRFNTSTSLNDFKTWIDANPVNLCYELATGTDFTFAPISPTPETALGVNNFWADEGDSDVTYRADINLVLQALGGRGLSMMRPINTEEIEYEEDER